MINYIIKVLINERRHILLMNLRNDKFLFMEKNFNVWYWRSFPLFLYESYHSRTCVDLILIRSIVNATVFGITIGPTEIFAQVLDIDSKCKKNRLGTMVIHCSTVGISLLKPKKLLSISRLIIPICKFYCLFYFFGNNLITIII